MPLPENIFILFYWTAPEERPFCLLFHRVDRADEQRQAVRAGDGEGERSVQIHLHDRQILRHRRGRVRHDGGERRGLAALLVDLHAGGVLHLRDRRRLVKICQRREVRPRIVECVRHAEHFERVGQLQIGVDVELRHAPDELRRLRFVAIVHIGKKVGQRRFAAQQRRERRALVGQQEDHALPAAEGKLRDGVALAADLRGPPFCA